LKKGEKEFSSEKILNQCKYGAKVKFEVEDKYHHHKIKALCLD
jgi:hypothetical protein